MQRYIFLVLLTLALGGYVAYSQQTDNNTDAKITDPAYADLKKLNLLFAISSNMGGKIDVSAKKDFTITLNYPRNHFKSSKPSVTTGGGLGDDISDLLVIEEDLKKPKRSYDFYFIKQSPPVYVFSDRPYLIASKMTVPSFLKIWNEPGSFEEDPPNAHFVYKVLNKSGVKQLDVVLSKPKYSQRYGTVTFTAKLVNPNDWDHNVIKNDQLGWATLNIDGFCCGGGSTVGHAVSTVSGDAQSDYHRSQQSLSSIVSSIEHSSAGLALEHSVRAAEKKAHIKALKDLLSPIKTELKKAGKEVAKKAAAVEAQAAALLEKTFIGKDLDIASDELKKQIVALYGHEKCFAIENSFVLADASVAAIEALATAGVDQANWEAFASAWVIGAASGYSVEVVSKAVEKVSETAGASKEVAECIGEATDILAAQAVEWGSMSAFLVDIFKQITLEKQHCANLFASCFAEE